MNRRILLASVLTAAICPAVRADEPAAEVPPFAPTDQYDTVDVAGWRVLVLRSVPVEHPETHAETMVHLQHQLYQIVRRLPAEAVEKVRQIPIWVEHDEPHHPCMCYHPDAGWLRDNGMNPDKAGAVEIANAGNFLTWTIDQPWMVLHELAHGYHHQFLERGFDNAEVLACFEKSMAERRYDEVQRISGRNERAYAATNQMEYFAEASEALFGANDFYPYVRAELQQHDPDFHALLEKLWLVRE